MPNHKKIVSVLLVLLVSLIPISAFSAEDDARPRIGLVLGGGGARGAAHIGVLKELERLQIPIDAIAGTSMGAIVGGLYAAGTSAEELDEIVRSLDWSEALSDTPRHRNLSFRRKQDDVRYPVGLELGVGSDGIVLPKGLVQGQNLDLVLRKLTADATFVTDFDDLPIPFRAVATDIVTGDAHIMAGGDLARAIRASMSVPGLISPTTIDGKSLVDGGIVANLPISVVREMGVDIVIAVKVDFPLYASEELDSAPAITEQILTILMSSNTEEQIATLEDEDVLIKPALGTFSSSDFAQAGVAVDIGLESIAEVEEKLQRLSMNDVDYANHLAARKVLAGKEDRLEFVNFEHDGRLATELLAARAGVEAGDAITPEHLADGANRLYGLDMFEQVSYKIVEEQGQTGVVYSAVGKSWGPDFLNVGVSLQDDFDGSTAFNLAARLTKTGLNQHGAEWRTDAQLGTDLLLQTEFYQPFGKGLKYFVAPRFQLRQSSQNLFADSQSIAEFRIAEGELGIDIGAELGSFGEFRMGVYSGNGEARLKIGDPLIPDYKYDLGAVFAQVQIDTFDESRFPRSGMGANLRWDASKTALGASEDFDRIDIDILSAWSRGSNTLNLGLSYTSLLDNNTQLQAYTPMGGFLNLSGFNYGQITGPHAAIGRIIYFRRLGESTTGIFDVPVYIGASAEFGNVWQDRSDIDIDTLIANGSLFAAFDTFIGAIYFAAGFAEGGEQAYYFSIGSRPRPAN